MSSSSLRQRRPRRPSTTRTDSCPSPSLSSSRESLDPLPTYSRRRSYSLYDPAQPPVYLGRAGGKNAFGYGSSLLQSLDLQAGWISLREFLAGKVDDAERGLKALRDYVEDGEAKEELMASNSGGTRSDDEEDEELDEEEERDEDEDEVHDEDEDEPSQRRSERKRSSRAQGIESEITALEQFIQHASRFLTATRTELRALAESDPSTTTPFVRFHLSDDARAALDQFLEEHPLPSFPKFDAAASSANALLLRVANEMRTLKDTLYAVASDSLDAPSRSQRMSAYLAGFPSPAIPDFDDLRSYFAIESHRLRGAARHFKDETTESFQAGLHHLSDGAAELSAYVKDHSSAAFDEAKKMYHLALEIGKTRLLKYDELPHEWRNNEFIITGYRYIPIEQWGTLLRSGWQWHNETVNIQSHFLGFLSLVGLLVYYLSSDPSAPVSSTASNSSIALANAAAHPGDTAIAVLFVAAGMKCLLSSAAWHLLAGCATSSWFQGAACLDYVGISGLIAASVMAAEYYGFYDHANLAMAYMVFSSIVGITGMIVPWSTWFNKREYKAYRIAFFVALAASAAAPVAHRAILCGFFDTLSFYSPVIPSVAAYLVGLVFYAHQFPECCAPGHWNFGSSHNLWHIAIVVAVWLQWRALAIWSTEVHLVPSC